MSSGQSQRTHGTRPSGSEGDPRLIGQLLRAPYQAVVAHVRDALAAQGFTDLRPAHLGIFQHIDHPPGGSRVTALAERLQITKQSAGDLADHLERRGYVERVPDPSDGRARLVRLTERGWRVHEAAAGMVQGLEAEWGRRMGADKMAQLLRLLRELDAHLAG
jgi:DNA-binding MarR family transcriptional regulator